jgi:purine-nucleoside phosphorylase
MDLRHDPYALAHTAAAQLTARAGVDKFDIAIVLGSGWQQAAETLAPIDCEIPTSDLPGFHAPSVQGHKGRIMSIEFAGKRIALVAGRVHLYEGHPTADVVHPVRTVIAAGADTVILTNAAGGIDPNRGPGTMMLISDHINLTATSPMEGASPPEGYGSRFVDLSDVYSRETRAAIRDLRPDLTEGVYVGFRGPHYETPAEIKMAKTMGGDLVGMSTVLEAIAARHLGARVIGFSLVTNLAAGVSPTPLNHLEVLEAGQKAAAGMADLFRDILPCL